MNNCGNCEYDMEWPKVHCGHCFSYAAWVEKTYRASMILPDKECGNCKYADITHGTRCPTCELSRVYWCLNLQVHGKGVYEISPNDVCSRWDKV